MAVFDDLPGTLHAALLIFLPMATGGLIFAFRSRPSGEGIWRTVGLFVLIPAAFYLLAFRYRSLGLPLVQPEVLLACAAAGVFVGPRRIHQVFCTALLVAACGMFFWYAVLVQGRYVGTREWVGDEQRRLDRELEDIKALLLAGERSAAYEPGWLDETDLYRMNAAALGKYALSGTVDRARPLWHTWLTRLYARVPVQRAVYYQGGRIAEGAPLMEWRDRR